MSNILINYDQNVKPFDLIIELMNCSKFRALFDNQFNTLSDIETTLAIMKAYQYIETKYIEKYNIKPSIDLMKDGIRKIISNKVARRFLLSSIKEFMNTDDKFETIVENESLVLLTSSLDNSL